MKNSPRNAPPLSVAKPLPEGEGQAVPDMVTGIVARGRTINTGSRQFGPGAEVELTADEAASFRQSGFLVDPDAPVVPVQTGQTFKFNHGDNVPHVRVA